MRRLWAAVARLDPQRRRLLIVCLCLAGFVVCLVVLVRCRPGGRIPKGQLTALGTEHNYLVVEEGDKVHFPVRRKDADWDFSDGLFEIIGVLGNPRDPGSRLTDFEKRDIWLVLRPPRYLERMFLFRLQAGCYPYSASRPDQENMDRLRQMFEAGYFYTDAGPITRATDLFLVVELHPCDAWAKVSKFPDELEVRGREVEQPSGVYKDYFYAETFDRLPTKGKLVVGLREAKLFSWPHISNTGIKLCYFQVRVMERREIEDRTELEEELPRMLR